MSGSAFVAPLALEIDSRPALDAVSALDRLSEASGRTEGRVGAIRTATDALVAALTKNTTATAALTSALAQVDAAGGRAGRSISEVGASAASATTNVVRFDRSLIDTRTDLNNVATSARDATAAWAALGAMGTATAQRLDVARRMAAASAMATPGAAANQNGRLRADQVQNLMYQGGDILASAGSGASLGMIAIQQGPQIAQVFGGPGGASVRGALSQAGEAATSFLTKIGPVALGLGGLTVAASLGAVAMLSYRSAQQELEQSIGGVGRATGVTVGQINAMADAQARAAGMSRSTARETAAIYVGAGRVGPGMLGDAVGATRDFAKFMGVDEADGATALAGALGNVSKGAADLSERYGLLSAAQAENVQRMEAQGNRLGAQRALLDAVRESTKGLAEQTSAWGFATQGISDLWDALGRSVDRAVTGGNLDERLKTARDALADARRDAEGSTTIYRQVFTDPQIATYEKQVADLQRRVDTRDALVERLQRNQRGAEIAGIVRSLLPERQEFERLQDQVEKVRRAITEPVRFGLDGSALYQTEAAFSRISRLLATMADDITRFGSSAAAAAVRTAEFNNRTVGFTPTGRSAAEVQQRYENELRLKGLDPSGPTADQLGARYDMRMGATNDLFERGRLAQERDARLQEARERDSYRQARDTELDTLRRTQQLEQAQTGGALSRLPQEVRQQFLTAAQNPRYARIPVGIAAAITGPESGGNLDVGYSRALGEDGRRSSAYGLGQITAGTAADAARRGYLPQGYDRTNRSTMAEGILGVLSMKLDENGGDLTRAIMAYRGSADPSVNRAYAAKVMRDAGQMGDASALGQVRDQDANSRALKSANDNVRALTESYGRNGAALEAQSRATEQYNSLIARGVPAADAASIAFSGLTDRLISVERAGRLVQFARDNEFSREQLGRSRIDQQAYAVARSRFGDTSSPEALAVIGRTRDTLDMAETKSLFSDGMTSFVTELRRGGDATAAFTNAAGNAADRLIAKFMDSAISSAFGAVGGNSGGGIGGFLSGLFGGGNATGATIYASPAGPGFSTGGFTGPGGRLDPAGIVHRGEYVFDAASTARIGVGTLERLRAGLRGYAEGGLVGWQQTAAPPANANTPPSINFITPPGVGLEPAGPPQRRADGGYDQVLRSVEGGLGQRMARGQGPFRGVSGAGYRNG
ncbi:phage tail length tape measure family protein [Methylorubrum extorquens]|uniref:phage tail length tape measure family protein n=1 Tax=Methylorubrum extorquens TaxID=408 RepID=UPI00223908DE|nr:phage tail length tape measure family protein [Methylorubrum extorquens]UYW34483.1 phage tail length tape measure family protein [Methylorubrum extorquens]